MSIRFALALPLSLLVAGCVHASPAAPQAAAGNGPLWTVDGGSVVPALGSVDASVPCHKTSLYDGYLRSTLFIEGLDGNGARVFVATGFNPLHRDVEVPPPPPPPNSSSPSPSSGAMSWQAVDTPATLVTTLIAAPFTPALVRLRWYDVDDKFQPRLIGET